MIRTILAATLIVIGLLFFLIEIFGVYKFNFILNRMHAAAMGDTMGMLFSMLGLIVYSGVNFTSLKLLLVVLFLCFSSPVSSHLITGLEVETNEKAGTHYEEFSLIPDAQKEELPEEATPKDPASLLAEMTIEEDV